MSLPPVTRSTEEILSPVQQCFFFLACALQYTAVANDDLQFNSQPSGHARL